MTERDRDGFRSKDNEGGTERRRGGSAREVEKGRRVREREGGREGGRESNQ